MPPSRCRLLPVISLALISTAPAALRGPYAADADTLHLYAFEESAGAVSSANAGTAGRSVFAVTLSSATSNPATVSTVLGATGAPGFGLAADLGATGRVLGYDGNGNGSYDADTGGLSLDRVALATLGITGPAPFTLEALVRPTTTTAPRHIISTDSSAGSRGFQFRLNLSGSSQIVDFNLIGTGQQITANLPASGPHAYATGKWFHVALVYTGASAQFYWTALDAAFTAPNPVGPAQIVTFAAGAAALEGPLTLGNENRAASGESLAGDLDQVRISKVARTTSEFVFTVIDTDADGLPDEWETLHFGDLDEVPDGDPDGDDLINLQEYRDGTNPLAPTDPLDTDGDGQPDAWELAHFGNLSTAPADDTDGDSETNAAEFLAGTAPNHRASNSTDTDADALPDAWETARFATLELNGGADPDRDGFSNLQELLASPVSTDPADSSSRPPGTAATLVPVDDGDPATSDFGYGGGSSINAVAFIRSALQTVGDQQFIAWYGRHQYDSAAPFNNTIWIGRRTLGSSRWEVFRHPAFTANAITDGHDVVCFGIDGAGYLHASWGMHGDAFHYARSTTPVTGSGPITLGPDGTMTGRENSVTYPQFLRRSDGDLLYLFREGGSGSGDTYLNRYKVATGAWSNVHRNLTGGQLPFIKGAGWSPDYNAYPNMPQLDAEDNFILAWCWRYNSDSPAGESGYQTNNNFAYARSTDGGLTWRRSNGAAYTLPISRDGENGDPATAAEHIIAIPEGSSLINQAGMCLDAAGQPVIASWWAPETASGNFRRQYMVVFRADDGSWQTRAVSARANNPAATKYSESSVRDLGRPIVMMDRDERIIVVYRDDAGAANGLTVAHSLPRIEDPGRLLWTTFDLTTENLGAYEPVMDYELWARDNVLHLLHQPATGKGYTAPANTASRISVLEWNAADYFHHSPQPGIETTDGGAGVTLRWRTEPSFVYRLETSTDLLAWTEIETRAGNGEPVSHRHLRTADEPRRFWRLDRTDAVPSP